MSDLRVKKCPACGENFKTEVSFQIYCSPECRRSKEPFYVNRELMEKVCPVCTTKFETYRKARIYCTEECKKVANRKAAKEKYCPHCGKIIVLEESSSTLEPES